MNLVGPVDFVGGQFRPQSTTTKRARVALKDRSRACSSSIRCAPAARPRFLARCPWRPAPAHPRSRLAESERSRGLATIGHEVAQQARDTQSVHVARIEQARGASTILSSTLVRTASHRAPPRAPGAPREDPAEFLLIRPRRRRSAAASTGYLPRYLSLRSCGPPAPRSAGPPSPRAAASRSRHHFNVIGNGGVQWIAEPGVALGNQHQPAGELPDACSEDGLFWPHFRHPFHRFGHVIALPVIFVRARRTILRVHTPPDVHAGASA
jgi:hypothetical protein